jgi:hypothetical protein
MEMVLAKRKTQGGLAMASSARCENHFPDNNKKGDI